MNVEPHSPYNPGEAGAAHGRAADSLAQSEAQERADIEEDRRRQRELDDAELGGEG